MKKSLHLNLFGEISGGNLRELLLEYLMQLQPLESFHPFLSRVYSRRMSKKKEAANLTITAEIFPKKKS